MGESPGLVWVAARLHEDRHGAVSVRDVGGSSHEEMFCAKALVNS